MIQLNEQGKLIGYNCDNCNGYNDITSNPCIYCNLYNASIEQSSGIIRLTRSGEFHYMTNEDRIELHAKFFAEERLAIRDLTDEQMNERREEFRKIAFEAKARLTAHDSEERERNATKSKEQKAWLVSSDTDPNITEALLAVKQRKERQSKADRMKSQLEFLGISGADKLVAQIASKQTGRAITSAPTSANPSKMREKEQTASAFCLNNGHHQCDGKFRIGDVSKICDCQCHKPKVKVDLSKISFKKKD